MSRDWITPRLEVSDEALTSLPLDGQPEPLAEDERGEVVLRGWFRPPRGEIAVEGLATFGFSCGGNAVRASQMEGVPRGDLIHSFFGTVLPLVAWACWGVEAVHASAARSEHGVVAFCGPSGAGKSTIGYGMAARGHGLFAEDAVAFRSGSDGVSAIALPFTVNLREPSANHFGGRSLKLPSRTKVHRSTVDEDALVAVVLLTRVEEKPPAPRIARLPPPEALVALLPNAYRFRGGLGARGRKMLHAYLALIAAVPVYRLTYGRDFGQLDSVLDCIEAATGL